MDFRFPFYGKRFFNGCITGEKRGKIEIDNGKFAFLQKNLSCQWVLCYIKHNI